VYFTLLEWRLEADVWSRANRALVADGVPEIQINIPIRQRDCSTVRERAISVVDDWIVDGAPDIDEEWQCRSARDIVNDHGRIRWWECGYGFRDCSSTSSDTVNEAARREHQERFFLAAAVICLVLGLMFIALQHLFECCVVWKRNMDCTKKEGIWRLEAFEIWIWRCMMKVSWTEHKHMKWCCRWLRQKDGHC